MKPHLLLDCDGVLADFVSATLDLVFEETGHRYDSSIIRTWEVFDSLPEPAEVKKEIYARLKGPGGCYSIPVYPGAKEAIEHLRRVAAITIVTSPFHGSETWMHERTVWLEDKFGFQPKDIIHAANKTRIHGDVFLDDKPDHLHSWADYWAVYGDNSPRRALLWDTERSTEEAIRHPVKRVKSWDEVIGWLENCKTRPL